MLPNKIIVKNMNYKLVKIPMRTSILPNMAFTDRLYQTLGRESAIKIMVMITSLEI